MTIEFVNQEQVESGNITVDDVEFPGVYEVVERGPGITEEYRAEREQQSGGRDEADEPEAAQIIVHGYVQEDTYEQLNALRESRDPFPVSVGPFAFDEMGVRNIEGHVRAEENNAIEVNLRLQEYRHVIIQQRDLSETFGGASGPQDMNADTPEAGWVDRDGDGYDDRTGDEIPDYETIPLASGQRWTHTLGSGESFGRRLIDASAGGAEPTIDATGEAWAIQDIGVRGTVGSSSSDFAVIGATSHGSSNSLVRNIYLGDGSAWYGGGSNDTGPTGVWMDRDSTQTTSFEYIHVAGFSDNGLYLAAPESSAGQLVDNCFCYNNGVNNIRMSYGEINNSVLYNDGGGFSEHGGRCLWCWEPGPVDVNNSEIRAEVGHAIVASEDGSGASVNLNNTNVTGSIQELNGTVNGSTGGNANPEGYSNQIPGSPTDAAAGMGSSDNVQ